MDAIQLPHGITLPTTLGAPGTPLQPGQVIQALVLELLQSGAFRLQLPQATVDVRTDVSLIPGSTVTLAVKGSGPSTRLVIYADGAAPPRAAAAPAPMDPPSLAGLRPIGEAVIVARAPAPAPGRPALEPIAHDAPAISPPRSPVRQPEAPAQRIVTPEHALGEAVRAAATRQSGLAPLFADVEQVMQAMPAALPAPVRAAAAQVLALRVPLDENLTATDVKQAFVRSGVLFEPRLAARQAPAEAPAQAAPQTAPAPAADLKAALLVFRQVLKTWAAPAAEPAKSFVTTSPIAPPVKVEPNRVALPDTPVLAQRADAVAMQRPDAARPPAFPSPDAAIRHLVNAIAGASADAPPPFTPLSPEQAESLAKSVGTALLAREAPSGQAAAQNPNGGPPPPYRGAALAAQHPVPASLAPDATPQEAAERLIARTEGAIARTTLLQVASLPDQPDLPRTEAGQRWTFEVPFATQQGTGIAQFEVSRDGRNARQEQQTPVWRARFSLDVEPMGPVHALIALTGERASVTLWAERAATATRLNEQAPRLSEALRAAELEPSDVRFLLGTPPAAARQAVPGRFMDRAT